MRLMIGARDLCDAETMNQHFQLHQRYQVGLGLLLLRLGTATHKQAQATNKAHNAASP